MSVMLGRELVPGEMVYHRDDVKTRNWPEAPKLGDAWSNAADSLRNGQRQTEERHQQAKLSGEEIRANRRALARQAKGRDLAISYGFHKDDHQPHQDESEAPGRLL